MHAICCRPEVASDVISGRSVKTIERYAVLNREVASFNSFRDISQNHFVTAADTATEADIDESIKRKRIRVSFKRQAESCSVFALSTDVRCKSPE